jgi:aryl carrier-like protein
MTQTIDKDWLLDQLTGMIEDDDDIDPSENLTHYGLDSVAVMRLISDLERRGIRVTLEELSKEPTADAWWALISSRQAA